MVDPKPKLELPCPRCGTLNGPVALRCRQCAHELEATLMPDWPQPSPFDLPGATATCSACGQPNKAHAEACTACGETLNGPGLIEEAVVKATAQRPRMRPRRRVGPLLNRAGWARLAWFIRIVAAVALIWSVLDSAVWLNNATAPLGAADHAAATRLTTHAIYELTRNVVLVAAVWLLTVARPSKDA